MDYINYVKQSPMSMSGMGGPVGALNFHSGASAAWYGVRGIWGNSTPRSPSGDENSICYFTVMTTGNASDFGDLQQNAKPARSGGGGPTRAVFSGNEDFTTIDYITIANTGNASTFGAIGTRRSRSSFCCNGTRGIFAGGYGNSNDGHSPNVNLTSMEFITMDTTGNASSYGTLVTETGTGNANIREMTGTSDATRGLFAGGGDVPSGSGANAIRYITVDTNGNSSDFGNLSTQNSKMGAGTSAAGRAVFGGGSYPNPSYGPNSGRTNQIDYVAVQSTGNASDFGNLTQGRSAVTGCAGGPSAERAVFAGGYEAPSVQNTMDYVTISSTGNASNFGDMQMKASERMGCSGDA